MDLDRVSVIKLGTRGAASAKKPTTAGGIFHNQEDELVGIHKHEAKILLDLCKEKNMKNCDQKGRRENLSIFYEERKKKAPSSHEQRLCEEWYQVYASDGSRQEHIVRGTSQN